MVAVVQPGFPGRAVEYPERDGQPMAETGIHIREMVDTLEMLTHRYRAREDVFVAGNQLIYFVEGDPTQRFAPDIFVVFGVPSHVRRIYKLWEEQVPPAFVLEFTSRGTRLEDKGGKKVLCAELGVGEYFLFDPEADYLDPPLQGFRLAGRRYEPIAENADGSLTSETLGLILRREASGRLRFIEAATGKPLLRAGEARDEGTEALARAAWEAARATREAARAVREAERADAAEAEITRLRALLAEQQK